MTKIMKKTYNAPEVVVYTVNTTEMIALSKNEGSASSEYGNTGDNSDVNEENEELNIWNMY